MITFYMKSQCLRFMGQIKLQSKGLGVQLLIWETLHPLTSQLMDTWQQLDQGNQKVELSLVTATTSAIMKVGLFFYFHEDYRRYLMDELLNGRTNVPTHPTQITFLKTSLISFKSVMDGWTTSLPIKFLLHVFMFNLSINMILDNDNGLWQVTLWNNEYDTDLAVKLSNMSEVT